MRAGSPQADPQRAGMASVAGADIDTPREVARRFQGASTGIAAWQVASTFVPLAALLAAIHAGLAADFSVVLVLGLPAAGFVVRAFALQHDCGHGSLFPARWLNDAAGRFCSLFTLTPYGQWRRQHAGHHAVWNDLDHRDRGADIYSSCTTVSEYRAMGRWRRLAHRTVRHWLVAQIILPPLIFLLLYRLPFDSPASWRRERQGVLGLNGALAVIYGGLGLVLGFGQVLLALLAVMVPASIVGVWLFAVQHRFEGVRWLPHDEWSPVAASMDGSSFLKLPRVLQWFTGSLGFHHLHHLAPRIPNYQLQACQQAHPAFAQVHTMTLRKALAAPQFTLWDEAASRMVRYRDVGRLRLTRSSHRPTVP